MKLSALFIFIFLLKFTEAFPQKCSSKEGYNPINDSLSWVVGRKDQLEMYINKSNPKEIYMLFSVQSPVLLSTTIGDSVVFIFDDESTEFLLNCKNIKSKTKEIKFLYVTMQYTSFTYIVNVPYDILLKMSKSKIKKFYLTFSSSINPIHKMAQLYERKKLSKRVVVTSSNEVLKISFNNAGRKVRRLMIHRSLCALRHIQ